MMQWHSEQAGCQPCRGRGQLGMNRKFWQAWEQGDKRARGVWIMKDDTHTHTHVLVGDSHALATMLMLLLLTVAVKWSKNAALYKDTYMSFTCTDSMHTHTHTHSMHTHLDNQRRELTLWLKYIKCGFIICVNVGVCMCVYEFNNVCMCVCICLFSFKERCPHLIILLVKKHLIKVLFTSLGYYLWFYSQSHRTLLAGNI